MDLPSFFVARQQVLAEALDRIAPRCEHPPCDVHRSIRYTLLGPSKRVRGVLTLLVADLFESKQDAIGAAAAIELVHASSLILDDLPAMDDTDTRRGRPANHVEFGEATAILAAVALLTLAFGHLASAYDPPLAAALARIFSEAIGSDGLIGGQAADLQLPAHPLRVAEIEPVDERKTAVLFRAAAAAGAMVGGAADRDVEHLADFGDRVGLAFQIVDDILDTTGDKTAELAGDAPPPRPGCAQPWRGRTEARGHVASLADLSEARQRAEELSQSAIALLQPFGARAEWLRELARFVVDRAE
jgi:geranylgeranyl diphosphate synthase type II